MNARPRTCAFIRTATRPRIAPARGLQVSSRWLLLRACGAALRIWRASPVLALWRLSGRPPGWHILQFIAPPDVPMQYLPVPVACCEDPDIPLFRWRPAIWSMATSARLQSICRRSTPRPRSKWLASSLSASSCVGRAACGTTGQPVHKNAVPGTHAILGKVFGSRQRDGKTAGNVPGRLPFFVMRNAYASRIATISWLPGSMTRIWSPTRM